MDGPGPRWSLTLYVSGASPRSAEAIATVRRICDEDLAGHADLDVVNAIEHPRRVVNDRIIALPTLVKRAPEPARQLVGDLTDPDRVRLGLDLGPASSSPDPTADGGGDHP
ncbi:MAG: circadian clock KaiB family protein [Marmoricola sp.]